MIQHQITNSFGNYNYNAFIYQNAYFAQHFHSNYELIYVLDKSASVFVNGVTQILSPGELLLLPPYTIHALEVRDGSTWVGVFSKDHIASFSGKQSHSHYSKFRCSPQIESFLREHLFFEGRPELMMVISCLYLVCHECIQYAVPDPVEYNHSFMEAVVFYISQNFHTDIKLKDLAASLNYEYHYFSNLFHQNFQVHFKYFINLFRFEAACQMLSAKQHSITQIAHSCGFGSIRNFNRVFQEFGGCTPMEYQSQK